MRSLLKSKKGQTLNLVSGTLIGLMVLVLTGIAVLFGIGVLNPSTFFGTGSYNANATTLVTQNVTQGFASFASYIPTMFIALGAVAVIGTIILLVVYARRMQGGGGASL